MAKQKVGEIFYEVTLDTSKMLDAQRKVRRELDETSGSLDGFKSKLTGVAAAISAYAAALYLIQQSDAFTKMNAQLKLATESTRELAIAQADVKRIAQEAQTDIASVASLYAKVTTSTKELGLAQKTVADITRTVSLALKVSGASAGESGSAILQLGQAFASGVLRGDEFNSVNEAAPRLMKALADGIGVPIGQLRSMAEAGKLTSEVLATALPKALKDLEQEAKQIQTISGAFQELKNEVMLFVGEQTTASGAVQVVAGSISALTNNLSLLAGILGTVAAVKFALWLESIVTQTYATVAANIAMRASNVAAAEAQVVATAATSALTAARVAELRAAVMATEGNMALAVATNGLIPAQARAAVAAEAHAAALGALTVAQRAASVSGTAVAGVMSLLGGPIGVITTLLGLGATAWMLWGKSADDSSKQAAAAMEASGREIIASLDKQNAKLKERLALANAGSPDIAKASGAEVEKLASTLTGINNLKAKGNALTGAEKIQLIEQQGIYDEIKKGIETKTSTQAELDKTGKVATDLIEVRQRLAGVNKVYLEDLTKLKTALDKGAISEKDYAATVAELAKKTYEGSTTGKDAKKSAKDGAAGAKRDAMLEGKGFAAQAYYQGLIADNKTALDKIDAEEQKALLENQKRRAGDAANAGVYEQAKFEISRKFSVERLLLAKKTADDLALVEDRNAQASAEARILLTTSSEQSILLIRDEGIRQAEAAYKRGQLTFEEAETAKTRFIQNEIAQRKALELNRQSLQLGTLQIKASSNGATLSDKENVVKGQAAIDIAAVEKEHLSDLENSQIYADRKVAIEAKMQEDLAALRNAANSAAFTNASDIFGSLASMAKNAAGEQSGIYKAMFAASKAFAIADSIVKIQAAMASAAMSLPFPANLGAIATVAAATANIVSTISGTSISGGRQYGGPANSGNLYRVNEKGAPEMFTAGNGQQYMMPTQSGRVTAADQVGGMNWTINVSNMAPGVNVTPSINQEGRIIDIAVRQAVAEVSGQFAANSGQAWSALRGSSNVQGRM